MTAKVNEFGRRFLARISRPKERHYWLLYAILCALYFFTYINANVVLLTSAVHDDALYFSQGEQIAAGNWLGEYNRLTLVKMPAYAMFLAFGIKTGLPYLWLTSVCHIVSVSYLLRKSRYLFRGTELLLLTAGGLLLFSPVLAGALRIYRFQLPAIMFPVFIGSIIVLFNPNSKRVHWATRLIDTMVVAMAFGLLWFSREENLFYVGCLIVALISFFLVRKSIKHPIRNLSHVIFGISGIVALWLIICSMNYRHYGRFVVCEKTASPFTDALKAFHSVSDPDLPSNISGTSASSEKILKIAEEVPMFETMAGNLISFASRWGGTYFDTKTQTLTAKPADALTISHFEWAWIDAANASGYYQDARTLAEFYSGLNEELRRSIQEGRLSKASDNRVQIGPYVLARGNIAVIARLIPKNYFNLFLRPSEITRDYHDLISQVSLNSMGDERTRETWASRLKADYIAEGDTQGYEDSSHSLSNRFWNFSTGVYAYTAGLLMHLATPLSLVAFVVTLVRKRWILSAVIGALASMYIAHYLMLTALNVVGGYNATHKTYFLASYATILFLSFVTISVLFNSLKSSRKGSNL